MAKWTTINFIQGFFNGTLGRKKVHGTYRILEGDHCRLLVRATTSYGRPSGNDLMAIDLSDENNRLCFWKAGYSRSFTYRMIQNIDDGIGGFQSLPESMLTGDEQAILNSGIVDVDASRILIEIGDKPFLLHRETSNDDSQTVKTTTLTSGVPVYIYANQVPTRVATIQEAAEKVKDPVDERRLVGVYWAKQMEAGFVPPPFDPEYIKTLSIPLNPLDYGFTMDECIIVAVTRNSNTVHSWIPKDKVTKTVTPQVQRWQEAVAKWDHAADAWLGRLPQAYKGITTASSKYAYSTSEETTGEIVVTAQGVFITGIIHSQKYWDKEDTLTNWYKLTTEANQITIPKRN